MKKEYCTQNEGDCSTCSLVNYGRDCLNNPIWGGRRDGAGRPSTGRKKYQIYVTPEEKEKIDRLVKELRGDSK